jgi:acetylornithine deacetylase
METPVIDADYAIDLARRLVRTDSVNPSLVPGAAGEAAIARLVADELAAIGARTALHEPEPGRTSVVGVLRGAGGGRSLMLNAHLDTVGVAGMADPFSGELRDGRIHGRGAYDMKGALAACIAAARALRDAGVPLAGDVVVAGVADEEHASLGTFDLVDRYRVDGAIVTEPTSLALCLAHKGFVWLEVTTRGRAAHGSRPGLGIDANLRMGRVLVRLEAVERDLHRGRRHPLVGRASLHAATLHGGTGLSTYAASCTLGIERRTIPGETEADAVAEIRAILDALRAEDPSFEADLSVRLARAPFEARPDSALAACAADALAAALGRPADIIGDSPWMDAAILGAAGIDTIVLGPHGTGAHADDEWVDAESVVRLAGVLAHTAIAYCGTARVRGRHAQPRE